VEFFGWGGGRWGVWGMLEGMHPQEVFNLRMLQDPPTSWKYLRVLRKINPLLYYSVFTNDMWYLTNVYLLLLS